MAKDPAMLWYWSDWNSGTAVMSRFLKGCYMDLLHAQFNTGELSLEEIKTCLGSDFGTSWPTLQKKFKQTSNGLFFNERLQLEKEKRMKFCESRRDNKTTKKPKELTYVETYDEHMIKHMENENENKVLKEKSIQPLGLAPVLEIAKDVYDDVKWREAVCMSNGITLKQLTKWMQQFNVSISSDAVHGFNQSSYKKMMVGWMQMKISKGHKVTDDSVEKLSAPPLKKLNHV